MCSSDPPWSQNVTGTRFLCNIGSHGTPSHHWHASWTVEMASNNGSVGKWEVVKKGKKTNNSGGGKNPADKKSGNGGRKALGESNLPTRRKWTWPCRALLADQCLLSSPQEFELYLEWSVCPFLQTQFPFLKCKFRRLHDNERVEMTYFCHRICQANRIASQERYFL